jgi:D-xylose 1-dehydrogenase (NADP+, D-xylono-1,5-lactone-forming)
VLRFPSNVLALFDYGTAMTERDELEVIGSDGSLFVEDPWHCKLPGIELRREGRVERIEVELANSYRLELENLSDAIRGDAALLLGRRDAVGQARVMEALHESTTSGGPVWLPTASASSDQALSRVPDDRRRQGSVDPGSSIYVSPIPLS